MTTAGNKRFRQIYLEITNACNLQCDFCPGTRRPAAFMPLPLFRKIAGQLPELTEQVYLHVMGEPLLHPEFTALIETCREINLPVAITTNGSRMTSPQAQALLDPIVRQINISLHSLYPLAQTAEGEQRLAAIFAFTKKALAERPELYLNFRLWNLAEAGEKLTYRNEWLFQRIQEAFKVEIPENGAIGGRNSRRLIGRLFLNLDTTFEWPEIKPDAIPRRNGFCHGLRGQLAILVDSTVVPCCLDREGAIKLGNVEQQPLQEILAAPRTAAMLDGLQHGILVEPLCQHCTFSTRFKK